MLVETESRSDDDDINRPAHRHQIISLSPAFRRDRLTGSPVQQTAQHHRQQKKNNSEKLGKACIIHGVDEFCFPYHSPVNDESFVDLFFFEHNRIMWPRNKSMRTPKAREIWETNELCVFIHKKSYIFLRKILKKTGGALGDRMENFIKACKTFVDFSLNNLTPPTVK